MIMRITQHAATRMTQRGFSQEMVNLALDFGEIDGDRYILNPKSINNHISLLKRQQKILEHAAKKGGITVVVDGEVVITTFRACTTNKTNKKRVTFFMAEK